MTFHHLLETLKDKMNEEVVTPSHWDIIMKKV